MYLPQRYSNNKNRLIILTVFLFLFIFILSFSASSLADNDEFITYQVVKGDTLWSISQKYNTSIEQLLIYNNINNKNILSPGQIIKMPLNNLQVTKEVDYITHTVKKGETLWSIAQNYNLGINSILAINDFVNPHLISIGQEIKIPSPKSIVSNKNLSEQKTVQENENENSNQNESLKSLIHIVKTGDNLWSISRKYGVSAEVIAEVNNLKNKDLLSIGQRLEIPAIGGGVSKKEKEQEPTIIIYTVVKGDTLWSISKRYDVKMNSIISANDLKEISRLSIGQNLKIPITNIDIAKAEGYDQESETEDIIYYVKKGESLWSISRNYNVKLEAIIAANNISDASKISAGQQLRIPNVSGARSNICNFVWPIRGRITSPFGIRTLNGRKEFHSGIDIGGSLGANIMAAESGRVSYAGYMRGYGNVIILSHDGGYSSVYAHNSVNLVKKGQFVKKGSVIAKLGRTGNATGPHLHFEIRSSGKPVNPLSYLK